MARGRRRAIAMAMALDPALLIADEPTTARSALGVPVSSCREQIILAGDMPSTGSSTRCRLGSGSGPGAGGRHRGVGSNL